jgi:hypothetical protein
MHPHGLYTALLETFFFAPFMAFREAKMCGGLLSDLLHEKTTALRSVTGEQWIRIWKEGVVVEKKN